MKHSETVLFRQNTVHMVIKFDVPHLLFAVADIILDQPLEVLAGILSKGAHQLTQDLCLCRSGRNQLTFL